jgi:hypothetical protein
MSTRSQARSVALLVPPIRASIHGGVSVAADVGDCEASPVLECREPGGRLDRPNATGELPTTAIDRAKGEASMNITSKSGSTTSGTEATLHNGRHERGDEVEGRRRWVAPIAAVAAAAVGSASWAAGLALPSVVGGMDLGNHNETLLSPAGDIEPPRRGNRSRRRVAVSALVVTASLALVAVAVGVDHSAAGDHAYPGNYTRLSSGGGPTT